MNIFDINLNLLKSFWAVYKTGGIRAGAQLLDLAPPAVSYNIRELERQLNLPLFISSAKGSSPTDEARAIFPFLEAAYHSLKQCEDQINVIANTKISNIMISSPSYIANYFLSPLILDFSKKNPSIKLTFHRDINLTVNDSKIHMLENNTANVVITHSAQAPKGTNIASIMLRELNHSFFASKSFMEKHNLDSEITLQQLCTLPLYTYAKSKEVVTNLEQSLDTKFNIREVPFTYMAYEYVADGQGIGYHWTDYLNEKNDPNIVRITIKDKHIAPIGLYCAYDKRTVGTALKTFLSELKKFFKV